MLLCKGTFSGHPTFKNLLQPMKAWESKMCRIISVFPDNVELSCQLLRADIIRWAMFGSVST